MILCFIIDKDHYVNIINEIVVNYEAIYKNISSNAISKAQIFSSENFGHKFIDSLAMLNII